MKTRMVSARCCCGAVGPIPCDPVTGITDNFQTLQESTGDGGWGYSVGLAVTPVISPIGTLVIDQNDPFFGVPWTFFRCAVWTPNFFNIRHYLKCQFENFGTEVPSIVAGVHGRAATVAHVLGDPHTRQALLTGGRGHCQAVTASASLAASDRQLVSTAVALGHDDAFRGALRLLAQPVLGLQLRERN